MAPVSRQSDLASDYLLWLRDKLETVQRDDVSVLVTPFLDPFHDGIQIYIEPQNGNYLLHDNGDTIDHLQCLGGNIEDSDRRTKLIERAIAGCAVRFASGRLESVASAMNFPQRVHFLLTAVLRLNDLWMSYLPSRPPVDFFHLVSEFLDQREVLYTPNVTIPGRTVDHPVDFVIPLPQKVERLVKLIGRPSTQMAKVVSFTWMELKDSRPAAQRAVVLNDVQSADPLVNEPEESFRQVSGQTVAILQGYSDVIYRWSQRQTDGFSRLWSANGRL